jgi:hAT family C-terminal dimerisation region
MKLNLKQLMSSTISSAECERGFSAMNLTHTSQRNSLTVNTMRELLFVKLNGPPQDNFPAERYVAMWIKEGHHSSSDKPSGRSAKEKNISHYQKLFL